MIKKIGLKVLVLFCATTLFAQKETIAEKALTKDIIYKTISDTVDLKMRFHYPRDFKKRKKYPTIVFFFGGGWNGGSILQFEDQAKYFASRGMMSVLVDYRVKSRHGTTPFDAVRDAKSAIRYLRTHAKKLGIAKNMIVASGGSAGGHLAAATALLKGLDEPGEDLTVSSKSNALVLYNPVIDNGPDGFEFKRMGGRHLEISPMHNIRKGAPPTIFFLGTKDKLIPVATAQTYKSKMEAVGSRCDVFLYEDQPHGFFNKGKQEGDKCYLETTREADLFLQSLKYLKGKATL